MGVTDGAVIGKTKIVDHGSPSDRWNLVIVSEGYQNSELATFATDAANVAASILGAPPFNDQVGFPPRSLNNAINVYRVDVSSTDSGADDPAACGGNRSHGVHLFRRFILQQRYSTPFVG